MEPRVDTNLGIDGNPDRWLHSACILCSSGCGLEIAVSADRMPVSIHKVAFGNPEPWLLERFADLSGQSMEPYAARSVVCTWDHNRKARHCHLKPRGHKIGQAGGQAILPAGVVDHRLEAAELA